MPRCTSLTARGDQCSHTALEGQRTCYLHSPAYKEQRHEAAVRAGRARKGGEIPEIKAKIRELVEGVLSGTVERADASVCAQLYGVLCRFVEEGRKAKMVEEFDERLSELERRQGRY